MNIEFFYFLLVFLIPRIVVHWQDDNAFKYQNIFCFLIELFLLIPIVSLANFRYFLAFVLLYHLLSAITDKAKINRFLRRIIEFLFLVSVGSFLFGIFLNDCTFNEYMKELIKNIFAHNAILSELSPYFIKKSIIYFFAITVLVNEVNNIIRFVLDLIRVEPMMKKSTKNIVGSVDKAQFLRGKIIGVIERIMFFLFVITGNYSSIAFILTAKGLTRFKELDDKSFAEYVLIGTLLSSALSIFWGYFITVLIKLI